MEGEENICPGCGKGVGEFALTCNHCGADLRERFDEKQQKEEAQQSAQGTAGSEERSAGSAGPSQFQTLTGTKARQQSEELDDQALDDALGGFNWGAFVLTPFWGVAHNWTIGYIFFLNFLLASFGPLLGLGNLSELASDYAGGGIAGGIVLLLFIIGKFYAGIRGNRIAWNSGRFDDVNQCMSVQQAWGGWGCGCLLFYLLFAGLSIGSVLLAWLAAT